MVDKIKMRKRNMKLFPIYRTLGWDYIFFYTINFLFLTQCKNINPADVVLIDSFYSLFGILMQIPAIFIIEYIGRKKSIVFAGLLNCIYMIVVMFSINLFNLIIAELLSSLAFSIKESADPAILNESIPPSKYKSKIFAKISQKGMKNYYIINSISTVFAGFLYDINPYIPITLSLLITIVVTIISMKFIEPENLSKKHKKVEEFNQFKEIKESFRFILKSERLKALILFSAVTSAILTLLVTYEISLLEEFNIEAKYLCIFFAILGIVSGILTKKQDQFHEKFKNKSLYKLFGIISVSILVAGTCGIIAKEYSKIFILLILVAYCIIHSLQGIYYALTEKYLRNFSNEKIDTKIFMAKNFLKSIFSAFIGIMASFLLNRINITYCMTIVGILSIIFVIEMKKYMEKRVGLKPEEYDKKELKYDELV